jgi:hypothetical protein
MSEPRRVRLVRRASVELSASVLLHTPPVRADHGAS